MFVKKIRPLLGLSLFVFSALYIFQDEGLYTGLILFCGGILLLRRELLALLPYMRAFFSLLERRMRKVEATRHCFLCGGPARYVILTAALNPDKPIPLDSARSTFYICCSHHPNPRKELPREEKRSAELLWYLEQNNLTYELVLDWIQGMHH